LVGDSQVPAGLGAFLPGEHALLADLAEQQLGVLVEVAVPGEPAAALGDVDGAELSGPSPHVLK